MTLKWRHGPVVGEIATATLAVIGVASISTSLARDRFGAATDTTGKACTPFLVKPFHSLGYADTPWPTERRATAT